MSAIPVAASDRLCGEDTFENSRYKVCDVDPAKVDLRLFWKNPEGEPYRSFSAVAEAVKKQGGTLSFAMNAGMYSTNFAPMGLYVEDGRELTSPNTRQADPALSPTPNFYKKPNGIFYIAGTAAGVVTTEQFLQSGIEPRFATQSGPMLVIDGQLHPALIPGSSDKTRRSGVAVCQDGLVRFAISEGRVNFHEFARLFRDRLSCQNALFLDGGRGVGVYEPETGRNDFSWHGGFGPMFGLVD